MSTNLFFALAAEHKGRTGHDIFTRSEYSTRHLHCDVCLYLEAENRDRLKAEAQYYADQDAIAQADAERESA